MNNVIAVRKNDRAYFAELIGKIAAVFAAVLLIIAFRSVQVQAAGGYTLSGDTLTITSNEGTYGWRTGGISRSGVRHIVVGAGVTMISSDAFNGCTGAVDISLPEGLVSIGPRAFMNCSSLSSVTIPSTVTTIGKKAFYGNTSLSAVSVNNAAVTIDDYAFAACTSLSMVNLGYHTVYLGNHVFLSDAALTQIAIPAGVNIHTDTSLAGSGIFAITLLDTYAVPSWYADALKYASLYNGTSSFIIYVPTSVMSTFESVSATTAAAIGKPIQVSPITASAFSSMVKVADSDDPGYLNFQYSVANQITAAPTDSWVSVTTDKYQSFNRVVYNALADRQDINLLVTYTYNGTQHTFSIPAGTTPSYLWGGNDYVSFLYLSQKLRYNH